MRDKYGVSQDKYCYPNSTVLINLLNIHNQDSLDEAEVDFTLHRYQTYESSPKALSEFSFEHLKRLHKHLFQDIYEWAGTVREVDISKGETRFCTWTRIEPEAEKLFKNIPELKNVSDRDELIEKIADLFCELNLLHPFREGNGRVLRLFFEELLYNIGYDLEWPMITQQDWIDANIAGVNLNLDLLKSIFSRAIT